MLQVDPPDKESQKDFSNGEFQDKPADKEYQDILEATQARTLDINNLTESLTKALIEMMRSGEELAESEAKRQQKQ